MSSYIERFRDFVRYTHPYTWATRVASLELVAILLLGLVFLVPKPDAGSIQAGLTIIAEILGVALGAVLVVTVLLIEQRLQAEEHLRRVLPKYRRLIESSIDTVNAAREELVERVRGGKIQRANPHS